MSKRLFPLFSASARSLRGFTLVEMVIVIAITGIIAAIVAVFIRAPVQGYVDTVSRAELADEADTAVRRMSRDLRLALPNSIRVSNVGNDVYLEFLLTRTGGRYLAEEDGVLNGDILSFTDASDRVFRVVGPLATGAQQIVAGDEVVIYNLGVGQAPANAYDCSVSCNRAEVASANSTARTITLTNNPFALQVPTMRSPGNRFQVVSTPVTYACNLAVGTLTRFDRYGIQAAQPLNANAAPLSGAANGLLATNVTGCAFNYATLANVRSALVGITLSMRRDASSGEVTLFHQLHVDNTP
ncbi:MAG: prepilin-type N-terminal cleavage/methylation domain-containing protein [Pseudomonadota bacterium]